MTVQGHVDVLYSIHEDTGEEGKVILQLKGTGYRSETDFQRGSIVILSDMCYRTEPGGIAFNILQFEISELERG
jgi:hypothetical protein